VIWTLFHSRRLIASVLLAFSGVIALSLLAPGAVAQDSPSASVDPNSGPPSPSGVSTPCPKGNQSPYCFAITLKNYRACAPDSPNCIIIDFIQGSTTTRLGTADSRGSATFTSDGRILAVPPAAKVGSATVHAHSTIDDASTGFTVTSGAATTTSSSSTSSSSTTSTSTTTTVPVTTTVSTVVLATTSTTAVPITTKKSSSHSDVPRYIAVALVVLAAAATAAVDTRLRRLRG
jgi:hypothetical protein